MKSNGLMLGWAVGLMVATVGVPALAQDDGSAAAAEKNYSLAIGVDYSSIYLFRGSDLLDDEPVLIPYVKATFGNLGVYYFGYFGDLPGDARYGETDLGLDYTFGLGDHVSLTVGGVTYLYSGDAEDVLSFFDTSELYAIVAVDTLLSPTITAYYDVDKVDGGYLSLGISHSFPLGSKASVDLSGSVGFDFGYNNKAKSDGTLNDVLLGVNLPWQVSEWFSVHAMVQQSIALDSLDARRRADPALTGVSEDETIFTVGASVSF